MGIALSELNIERDAESVNHMGDMEMRTKLRQDGAKLLEDTTFSGPQGTLTRKSVITLSEDGKTLTLDAGYESPERRISREDRAEQGGSRGRHRNSPVGS